MIEWLTRLFDNRTFMRINAVFGFLFLGFFLFFYFSKEGRDERGRGLNIVRLANGIQTVYSLFLLTTDIALLILRKIR